MKNTTTNQNNLNLNNEEVLEPVGGSTLAVGQVALEVAAMTTPEEQQEQGAEPEQQVDSGQEREQAQPQRSVEEIMPIIIRGGILNQADAMTLIDAGRAWAVAGNLNKFTGLNHQEIADKLIAAGQGWEVAGNLDQFTGLNHQEIADKIIAAGEGSAVAGNFGKFTNLSQDIADKLIAAGQGRAVAGNLNKFTNLSQDIADKLIAAGEGSAVAGNFGKFTGADERVLLILLSANGREPTKEMLEKSGVTASDREQVTGGFLPYFGEQALVDDHFDEVAENNNLDYAKIFALFNSEFKTWQDEENIAGPMRRGGEIFGFDKMFQYVNRTDTTRHDMLFAFDSIIKNLYENYHGIVLDKDENASDKKISNQFFSQILQQVAMDSSGEVGGSYTRLNTIAQNLDLSPDAIEKYRHQIAKLEAQGFGNEMQRLKQMLDMGNYFNSWKELQLFDKSLEQLRRAEVWEKLAILKQGAEHNPKKQAVYDYVYTLMFHEDSKVNLGAAEEFFLDPDSFLERMDDHAPDDVHDYKKPSNYIDIPELDLSGEELVEALASGELDKIQTFPGMSIVYELSDGQTAGAEKNLPQTFADQVLAAVGSRKNGDANAKLFGELNKYLKVSGLDANPKNYQQTLQNLTPEQQAAVAALVEQFPNTVNKERHKIPKNKAGAKRYRAMAYDKSNPKAALAGDDTNCCMPFGSGKNNVYTFNPNCGIFTVEVEKADGGWTTIAQSVLTLDQDIGQNVSKVMGQMESENTEFLHALKLSGQERYIACDNIEVRANYQNKTDLIGQIYQDFFTKYVGAFNQANLTGQTVKSDKIIVGQGYSDFRFGGQIENTFVPLAPMSYSDKLGSTVDVITLNEKSGGSIPAQLAPLSIELSSTQPMEFANYPYATAPLTFQDALSVAQLESKAYQGTSMAEGLSAMENSLIASMINNVNKNRPHLSLKHLDGDGNPDGYIVAYEGKIEALNNESGIYIEDLAADPNASGVGGRLILAFMDEYRKHYLDQNNPLPIYAKAREDTSYNLITKHLEALGRRLHTRFNLEELKTYEYGGRMMREIVIRPEAGGVLA
ncbi:MAG: hypothetical protein LBQ02_03700 [Candidatus Nomurabacteria bacterium]|jgi:hypothetical protein|nr:hypothetical protein [Candidatus Nomurabacteria bacterium]